MLPGASAFPSVRWHPQRGFLLTPLHLSGGVAGSQGKPWLKALGKPEEMVVKVTSLVGRHKGSAAAHTRDTKHTRVIHASRVPVSVYLEAEFREQGGVGHSARLPDGVTMQ